MSLTAALRVPLRKIPDMACTVLNEVEMLKDAYRY